MGGSTLWHPPPLLSRFVCDNEMLSLESSNTGSPRAELSGALRSTVPQGCVSGLGPGSARNGAAAGVQGFSPVL